MTNYTLLGNGKNTKLLAPDGYQSNRTVVTCDHDTAHQLANALGRLSTQLYAALVPAARDTNLAPVETRRRLLGIYDTCLTGAAVTDSCWVAADHLIEKVAAAVTDTPGAVQTAVRHEVGRLCSDLDGILAVGRVHADNGHKVDWVDLVVTAVLNVADWDYLLGEWGQLCVSNDTHFGAYLDGVEISYSLAHELYGCDSASELTPFGAGVDELFRFQARDEDPMLLVAPDTVRGWLSYHRPELVDAYDTKLSAPNIS
jgi:hypothetical protein